MSAAEAAKVGNPGPEGSVSKLEFANLNKELYDFCIDLMGPAGLIDYDYTFRRPTELDQLAQARALSMRSCGCGRIRSRAVRLRS